jgi:excinuclease UvrABC nuclease subunit
MQGLEWSLAYLLLDREPWAHVPARPGVYRIRAFAEEGGPLPIARAGGVDREGILHIGKANDLRRRIRLFCRAAQGLRASHHAGGEYVRWHFDRLVPRERLRFDYLVVPDEQRALTLERTLHEEYRERFLDRPPLDGTSGQTKA